MKYSEYYTTTTLATYFKVSDFTIRKWMLKLNIIPTYFSEGKRSYFNETDLQLTIQKIEQFLQKNYINFSKRERRHKLKEYIFEIYLITNLINNKKYVGQSRRGLKTRWGSHCSEAKRKNPLALIDRSIKKYGKSNFTCTLLEKCSSLEDLDDKEIYWIFSLKTLAPVGYNLELGGEKHSFHNELSKQKTSLKTRGEKNPRSKLLDSQRIEIYQDYCQNNTTIQKLMAKYSLPKATIWRAIKWVQKYLNFQIPEKILKGTNGENNPMSKLSNIQRIEIGKSFFEEKISARELAEKYNVCQKTIYKCVKSFKVINNDYLLKIGE